MGLLFTKQIQDELISELSKVERQIKVISAFCKTDTLTLIDTYLDNKVTDKSLLVRFKLSDIVAGATDISLFDYCATHNWSMYVNFDLHAKTYIFDNLRGIVGSCNLTSKGLGFAQRYNYEVATLTQIDSEDVQKINTLFLQSVKMNDTLFNIMKFEFDKRDMRYEQHQQWSEKLLYLCKPDLSVLFTYHFPETVFSCNLIENDYGFMELVGELTFDNVQKSFKKSIPYLWLIDQLVHADEKTLYFGTLTQKLHLAIINEPKPYRKEVKTLLANLLDWIQKLQIDEVVIDTPNHSQRVRINI